MADGESSASDELGPMPERWSASTTPDASMELIPSTMTESEFMGLFNYIHMPPSID